MLAGKRKVSSVLLRVVVGPHPTFSCLHALALLLFPNFSLPNRRYPLKPWLASASYFKKLAEDPQHLLTVGLINCESHVPLPTLSTRTKERCNTYRRPNFPPPSSRAFPKRADKKNELGAWTTASGEVRDEILKRLSSPPWAGLSLSTRRGYICYGVNEVGTTLRRRPLCCASPLLCTAAQAR